MKRFLCLAILCLGVNASAQNEFTKWYFGKYTGLDFMASPPALISHTTMSTQEGSASAADGAGNLLFYTDGITVWNKQQQVMANGTGLQGNSSTVQSALIVKEPGNQHIYYVFTLAAQGATPGLCYSLVDMSLAAGLGSVTVKNATITSPCTEQLTATRHCNGVDMWIVTHDFTVSNFRSFLLTSAGLNLTPVISTIGPAAPTFTPNNSKTGQGTIKISPTGRKLGLTFFNGSNNSEVAVFDFDRNTGAISNYLSLITGTLNFYGCEFSGDGTKFYTASFNGTPYVLYQWDLCAGSNAQVLASKALVVNPPYPAGQMQLAPDGRIYIAAWNTQTLSAINNPDQPGSASNYQAMAMSVATGSNGTGLPNFFGGAFKTLPKITYSINPQVSCTTASFSIPAFTTGCAAAAYSTQSVTWDFGHPASGAANTSTLNAPVHNYGSANSYTVKLILNYECGADTIYLEIFMPGPTLSVTSMPCATTATLNISGGTAPFSYTWFPSGQTAPVATITTGAYTITVMDGNSCSYSLQAQFNPLPGPTLTAQSVTTCPKTVATLQVSGANSYIWSPGNSTGPTYTASPTSTQVYTVSGSNTNGCTAKTTATITILNCSSVYEIQDDKGLIKIFPNPAVHEIFVETAEDVRIVITDQSGREMHRQDLKSGVNRISSEQLKSGIYFLSATGGSRQVVNKILRLE